MIMKVDHESMIERCRKHLWSELLEHRPSLTRGLQVLSKLMCNRGGGKKPCPECHADTLHAQYWITYCCSTERSSWAARKIYCRC